MPLAELKQSAHLRVLRVQDPDEFKAIGFLDIERQELLGPYYYGRAITALPGMLLMLEKTSPRRLTATMNAMGCTIIVPMSDQSDAVFNGQTWNPSAIGVLRKDISIDLRETAPSTFAVMRFSSNMQNRGWAETEGRLNLRYAPREDLLRLQHAIRQALVLSSAMGQRDFAVAAEGLRQVLIETLDLVLVSGETHRSGSRAFERHRKLVKALDEFAHSCPDAPLYSDALANQLGTSVRVLQIAVQEVHGSSLHQHLRNKRLWSLRAQLAKGMPTTSISSVAAANGFLHMGQLSHLYKATFGELPSETLVRSKLI